MCTESDGQETEGAGEIESPVGILFARELEYLVGHGSSLNSKKKPKTTRLGLASRNALSSMRRKINQTE
jgi:hypothetical protein